MTFEQLELISPILKALQERNYKEPTAIQEQAIPKILAKRDILGSAQTGTGKTAAFALPIIQLLHTEKNHDKGRVAIRSLIVTPTRELAIQIDENLEFYGKYTKLRHAVIFGGVKQGSQVNEIKRGVDILVATPGRLLDLINQGFIKLDQVKIFVLDEADRMLDMGFINDIKKLLKLLPRKRQSLFFSATMPDNIVSLADNILTDPIKIEVNPVSSAADTVQQKVYYTNKESKKDLLFHILENKEIDQVLLFSRTKHGADKITRNLKSKNINAAAIHGNKAQNHRQKVLSQFKEGSIRVLVATDIAARGIDIDKLQYVINYDVPEDPETYVHRIGRSGRAGESGTAIALCEPEENAYVRLIERLINQKIKEVEDNPYPQTDKPMSAMEKKDFNKEKMRKKQAFFTNRKKSR
ncbi:DEAD/DEAH box helicase [Cyclobacterium qasimii]|uniref:DEAD-box ATP-dependent RNA helicase RhpA n=2 Tax=Cyclobacterium qasimii TaxID=1350429 RepID=S7VEM4_9BACT|nr:DEAD/DEAH box helicase [Cyclobacterium qasimii]EPR68665.1 ATP-dependent RNA helicase RhlE [Cyclobacterium qasimii M12-11B]GEO23543.1 DEAD/DEAH box family ATP-dependent RNA helicase [Cyclobacterium qasimii]